MSADWLAALDRACEETSQAAVARRIGYSPAVVSQVRRGTYRGSLEAVERRVRRALMADSIQCPILGEITGENCLEHQRQGLSTASAMRVRLWRACRRCPHNLQQEASA